MTTAKYHPVESTTAQFSTEMKYDELRQKDRKTERQKDKKTERQIIPLVSASWETLF